MNTIQHYCIRCRDGLIPLGCIAAFFVYKKSFTQVNMSITLICTSFFLTIYEGIRFDPTSSYLKTWVERTGVIGITTFATMALFKRVHIMGWRGFAKVIGSGSCCAAIRPLITGELAAKKLFYEYKKYPWKWALLSKDEELLTQTSRFLQLDFPFPTELEWNPNKRAILQIGFHSSSQKSLLSVLHDHTPNWISWMIGIQKNELLSCDDATIYSLFLLSQQKGIFFPLTSCIIDQLQQNNKGDELGKYVQKYPEYCQSLCNQWKSSTPQPSLNLLSSHITQQKRKPYTDKEFENLDFQEQKAHIENIEKKEKNNTWKSCSKNKRSLIFHLMLCCIHLEDYADAFFVEVDLKLITSLSPKQLRDLLSEEEYVKDNLRKAFTLNKTAKACMSEEQKRVFRDFNVAF